MRKPKKQKPLNDLTRSLTPFDPNQTVVIELSKESWLVAGIREHRRAKTDRLDTEQLKRAFLSWLRGEPNHCKMCAIPTIAEEDAKRPHRERETLVGQQTTIVNRVKATLARLGIRSFNPKLKKAPERLEHLRTPEGEPIPPNTLAELQ